MCLDCKEILHQTAPDTNTWTLNINIATSMHNILRLQVSQSLKKIEFFFCFNRKMSLTQQMHLMLMEPEASSELCEILQVSTITLSPNETNDFITMSTSTIEGSLCPRCRRFAINTSETLCERCDTVLAEEA